MDDRLWRVNAVVWDTPERGLLLHLLFLFLVIVVTL